VLKGGLTSAMYTEVLQFFMIVLGFAPVVWLGLKDVGGWSALKNALRGVAQNPASVGVNTHSFAPDAWTNAWTPIIAGPAQNPLGVDVFAMVFGLGFVMSFGYWCTNFLVIQRAMAAKDMSAARRTPLIAALPKMLFPALVILPGMIAVGLAFTGKDGYKLPTTQLDAGEVAKAYSDLTAGTNPNATPSSESLADVLSKAQAAINAEPDRVAIVKRDVSVPLDEAQLGSIVSNMLLKPISQQEFQAKLQGLVTGVDYNGIILSLLKKYCPPGMMGLALTALLASFMSGMAGNVTAFNTVWTYDLYQAYLAPNKPDAHYVWMGKVVTVVGIGLSIGAAFVAREFPNAMDIVQLVFGFVNAPLFATFLLGMFWARTTSHGAFFGLAGGTLTSCLFHLLTVSSGNTAGWIKGAALGTAYTFPSDMARNFWLAILAFSSCLVLTIVISLATKRTKTDAELKGLVYSLTEKVHEPNQAWYASPGFLGTVLLVFCLALNIYFW
jgi:SSS family solute:Na+ symporter